MVGVAGVSVHDKVSCDIQVMIVHSERASSSGSFLPPSFTSSSPGVGDAGSLAGSSSSSSFIAAVDLGVLLVDLAVPLGSLGFRGVLAFGADDSQAVVVVSLPLSESFFLTPLQRAQADRASLTPIPVAIAG